MKVIKIIILVLVILFSAILGFTLLAPKDYKVEKSITIGAPYGLVYEQTIHWPNFQEWSPWSEMDPDMELNYEGEFGQVGSKYTWKGNKDAGSGSQEIVAASHERVDIDLHFMEPFESHAKTYYLFNLQGDSVTVSWGMTGRMEWPWNAMTVFIRGSIADDYEKGLLALKKRCENIVANEVVDGFWIRAASMDERTYIGKRKTVKWSEMEAFYENQFGAAMKAILQEGIEPVGAPTGLYFEWDEENQKADMMAAIPCPAGTSLKGFESYQVKGTGYMVKYYGPYEDLGKVHEAIGKYLTERGIGTEMVAIEEYVTDPETEEDPAHWLTKVYYIVPQ